MSKNSFRRAILAPATAGMIALSLLGAPAASAQSVPSIENLSSSAQAQLDNFVGQTREQAWNTRNQILDSLEKSNPQAAAAIKPAVDAAVNALFPGLIDQKNAEARAAREAQDRAHAEELAREKAAAEAAAREAEAQRRANQFDHGACPADADVCVDIDGRRTWLQDNGKVTYIAPSMAPGRAGQDTPRGTFYINRKIKDEISYEFNNAPMPYAMYFTNYGHAFHMGDPSYDSAGCVRLPADAAVHYWNNVHIGDKVVIY